MINIFGIRDSLFIILFLIMIIGGCIIDHNIFLDVMYYLKYILYFGVAITIYILLRVAIPKIIGKLNAVSIEFENKNYNVSPKRAKIIQNALAGDKKSQYELITEFHEGGINPDYIPKICFYFTKQMSDERNDLSVIVQLGIMYEQGVGVRKNKNKALEIEVLLFIHQTVKHLRD